MKEILKMEKEMVMGFIINMVKKIMKGIGRMIYMMVTV
jgi:hypothetical protein